MGSLVRFRHRATVGIHEAPAYTGTESEFVRPPSPRSWIAVRATKPNPQLAVILEPRTLFRFHEALRKRKYRLLSPALCLITTLGGSIAAVWFQTPIAA